MTDFRDMAQNVIESNRYMVLGTADEAGVPWVTPVWFAQSDYRRFIWVSSPDRRHSRNVRAQTEVSIVIFDSQVAVGDAASRTQGLTRSWALEDMLAPSPYRLYRATVSRHWVLDPDSSPDDRAEVTL